MPASLAYHHVTFCVNASLGVCHKALKKNAVFPLTRPTLFSPADPKSFFGRKNETVVES